MKLIITIFTLLFSISLFANNTESEVNIKSDKSKCAVENYELCLKHDNRGVVESALGNIIKLKYRCPEANFDCIFKQLIVLSQTDENENISKKAELVLQILNNPELVSEIGNNFYSDIDQFLDVILLSSRFEDILLITLNQ